MKDILKNILIYGGMLLVAFGVLIPLLFGPVPVWGKIVFSVGAVATLVGRILTPYRGSELRVRRLFRIQIWSAIFFCVAAGFMWYSVYARDWLAFTLAGGAIQCYVSIALILVANRNRREEK